MKIATATAIRSAEQQAFASGDQTSSGLMVAVGNRLCEALDARFGDRGRGQDCLWSPERVIIYAGRGNNAGDAIGLAASFPCPVLLRGVASADELSADAREQWGYLTNATIATEPPEPTAHSLILDGLLGSGSSGPLRPETAALVREMNALRAASPHSLTLAIDIPTGLLAGDDSPVVRADISTPIGCVKPAMLADGAEDFVGQLLPIELPEVDIEPCSPDLVMDAPLLHAWLPPRPYSCFKNRAGRVAIVAGSVGMLGAAQMTAEAALAAGAGLVVLYCKPETYPLLAARVAAEVMVRPVPSYADIEEPRAQTLLIGPGLGQLPEAEPQALRALAESFCGTVVLDADALNCAAAEQWPLAGHPNWVLTPHPGEMRRLAPQHAELPRREQVARFLEHFDGTLLLKGARTLIANRELCLCNSTGGPFMANGGQGDVLAGCISALAAQGLHPLHAAACGAFACGLAATRAWQSRHYPRAVRATQTLDYLHEIIT